MADTRFLKQRRQGWYFQIAVPADVRDRFGKPVIVKSLKTRDLTQAQRQRWALVQEWNDAFDRARGRIALTSAEIEQHVQKAFRTLLEEAEEATRRGEPMFRAYPPPSDDDEDPPDPEEAGLEEMADHLRDDLRQGETGQVAADVERIRQETGAEIAPGSQTYDDLAKALLRAKLAAVEGRLSFLRNRPYQPLPSFASRTIDPVTLQPVTPAKRTRAAAGAPRFSTVAREFLEERQRDPDAKLTEQTRGQHEAVFRLFSHFRGDPPLSEVTRSDATEFLNTVGQLHPNWGRGPDAKKLTLAELLEKYGGGEGLSNRTLNRYVSSLHGLFDWAKKRGYATGENPFSQQMRSRASRQRAGWVPFSDAELTKLFRSPLLLEATWEQRVRPDRFDMEAAMRWIPLIALFSGMRSGEVCQLRLEDVGEDQGVMFFHIREGEGQTVKTDAGFRRVPVHSTLIRCGFVEYLEHVRPHPSGFLFPGLKPGGPDGKLNWYFTKRFTEYRRAVGVDRDRVSFHSLRKNVGTALERAEVPESAAVDVLGHEKLSMSYRVYSAGLTIRQLRRIVEKIAYPALDLSHLYRPAR